MFYILPLTPDALGQLDFASVRNGCGFNKLFTKTQGAKKTIDTQYLQQTHISSLKTITMFSIKN